MKGGIQRGGALVEAPVHPLVAQGEHAVCPSSQYDMPGGVDKGGISLVTCEPPGQNGQGDGAEVPEIETLTRQQRLPLMFAESGGAFRAAQRFP